MGSTLTSGDVHDFLVNGLGLDEETTAQVMYGNAARMVGRPGGLHVRPGPRTAVISSARAPRETPPPRCSRGAPRG